MSKILVNSDSYNQLYDINHLYRAYKNAFRGNSKDPEAIKFTANLGKELLSLYKEISEKTYKPGLYRSFVVQETKRRVIEALPFRDRVAQHVLYDFIAPKYDKIFISTSYANRKGLGTQRGMLKEQEYLRKAGKGSWVLKGDIHHFFNSIKPSILKSILAKKIKDSDILNLCAMFMPKRYSGIPIGNVTSQLYANIYLNEFDHFIKDTLRVKYYIRYMDDFVMNLPTKEDALYVLQQAKSFLKNKLQLELNSKTQVFKEKQGVNFLGGIIYYNHIKIRHSTVKNIKRKIRAFSKKYIKAQDIRLYNIKLYPTYNSWRGLSRYFNARTIERYIEERITSLGINKLEKIKKINPYNRKIRYRTKINIEETFYSSYYINYLIDH